MLGGLRALSGRQQKPVTQMMSPTWDHREAKTRVNGCEIPESNVFPWRVCSAQSAQLGLLALMPKSHQYKERIEMEEFLGAKGKVCFTAR